LLFILYFVESGKESLSIISRKVKEYWLILMGLPGRDYGKKENELAGFEQM